MISQLREVSATVAVAVADAAIAAGLNRIEVPNTIEAVREATWSPTYPPILR
jgi:malate dehydrogenase (oxaloacetate-decarboxylating)